MKANIKVKGNVELSQADLLNIVKEADVESLKPLINSYMLNRYGYVPKEVIKTGDKFIATIDEIMNLELSQQMRSGLEKTEAPKRIWNGLYAAVGEVLDEQRKRKKSFISFDDLMAELLEMKDEDGKKLFVKNGLNLPMEVLIQRLHLSQIVRQAKTQRNLRGVKVVREEKQDGVVKKEGGLKFS